MPSAQPVQSFFQSSVTEARDALLALLYPTQCRVCGADHHALDAGVTCNVCWNEAQIKWQAAEHCVKCDARLRSVGKALPERQCPHCRDLDFTVARACGAYEGAWLSNILQLKAQPHLPPRMQQLLIATYERNADLHDCEIILPVPLHPERYAARQFNQAELIANALAQHTGLPVNLVSVVRAKATARHRAGMGADERAKSLRKAFRVRAPRLIQGKIVLIVDDVMTTGSTASELAKTLLAANARGVKVLTLARALGQYI